MHTLVEKELRTVELLRRKGILENVSWEAFHVNYEAIIVDCPDCDQKEKARHHAEQVRNMFGSDRVHRIQINGGALNIAPQSPLNCQCSRGEVLKEDIRETIGMKGIERIGLYSHYPCGKGLKHDISLAENIDLLVKGKRHLRELLPNSVVIGCFFYVCLGNNMGRTYFVNRSQWEEWREYFLAMDA